MTDKDKAFRESVVAVVEIFSRPSELDRQMVELITRRLNLPVQGTDSAFEEALQEDTERQHDAWKQYNG